MTDVRGLKADSPFASLFGDLSTSTLLKYVYESWHAYADAYKDSVPPLQKRTEPQLTQALAAFLRQRQDAAQQPFPGDFFGELAEYILDKSGLPKCTKRTDIEWRLYGVPGFIVEFKILDGKTSRRVKYLSDGVMRFVVGRYGGEASVGAMFGLLRKSASKDPTLLLSEMEQNATAWQCADVKKISQLFPSVAAFDTAHNRTSPSPSPFQLAHLFVSLP
jgi:hypothetical protein